MTCGCCEDKTAKLYFQLGDGSRGANFVSTGVCICSHNVGGLLNVGVVLAAGLSAGELEYATDAKGGGAAAGGDAPEGLALGGCVAGAVVVVSCCAGIVGELHHIEDCEGLRFLNC